MITLAIQIFIAQYVMILFLGIQSLNVRDGKILASAICSAILGVSGYFATGIISKVFASGEIGVVFWSYIIAGPIGISTSIWLHPKLKNFFHKLYK